jgi:hypothetical protein
MKQRSLVRFPIPLLVWTCQKKKKKQSYIADDPYTIDCSQSVEHSILSLTSLNPTLPTASLLSHPMITRSRVQPISTIPTAPVVEPSSTTASIINSPSQPLTDSSSQPITEPSISLPSHSMVTRSKTGNQTPKTFPDFKMFHSRYPLLGFHMILPKIEPSCYSRAATDPRW